MWWNFSFHLLLSIGWTSEHKLCTHFLIYCKIFHAVVRQLCAIYRHFKNTEKVVFFPQTLQTTSKSTYKSRSDSICCWTNTTTVRYITKTVTGKSMTKTNKVKKKTSNYVASYRCVSFDFHGMMRGEPCHHCTRNVLKPVCSLDVTNRRKFSWKCSLPNLPWSVQHVAPLERKTRKIVPLKQYRHHTMCVSRFQLNFIRWYRSPRHHRNLNFFGSLRKFRH